MSRAVAGPVKGVQRLGFTLIEVVIAITILGFITSVVYTSMANTIAISEIAEEGQETVNGGRIAMQRMHRELAMAFLDPRVYLGSKRSGATLIETYRTMFKGEEDTPISKLTFSSLSHVRLYHNSRESDQTELSYYGEPDEERPGLYTLMHRTTGRIDGEPEDGGTVEILARGVESLKLEYYDYRKEEWTDTWDDQSAEQRYRLPKAVAISMTLLDEEDVPHIYRTKVWISMWKALPPRLEGRRVPNQNTGTTGTTGGTQSLINSLTK